MIILDFIHQSKSSTTYLHLIIVMFLLYFLNIIYIAIVFIFIRKKI